tara:strand:- start:7338 stop:7787 length:450 start_codon:yes stop_codon:yes gene_type:complete
MPSFGKRSERLLEDLHPLLVKLLRECIHHIDFSLLETHRTPERQQTLVDTGRSMTKNSKHLQLPSEAFDFCPYPMSKKDWKYPDRFIGVAKFIMATCKQMQRDGRIPATFNLRWGGDWDSDDLYGRAHRSEQTFDDLGHIEMVFNAERR